MGLVAPRERHDAGPYPPGYPRGQQYLSIPLCLEIFGFIRLFSLWPHCQTSADYLQSTMASAPKTPFVKGLQGADLTPKQRTFVVTLVRHGCTPTQAARTHLTATMLSRWASDAASGAGRTSPPNGFARVSKLFWLAWAYLRKHAADCRATASAVHRLSTTTVTNTLRRKLQPWTPC